MPRDSTTLTFVIVGEETPIYECEIKAGAKVSEVSGGGRWASD